RCPPDTRSMQVVTARDTCAAAPSYIACGPKTFTVEADLAAAASSVQASCGVRDGGAGALVFNVVLGTRSNLRVSVAAAAPGSQPVVAVRERCGADVDLACRWSQGVSATYGLRQLAEGAYTVVLQGYDRAGAGPTRATVMVEPPSGARNETCPLAEALPLDGGVARAALGGADDDVALACNTTGGPDLFYRFTLTESSDVTIDSTSDEPLRAVLALWTSCELGSAPLGCTTASSTTGRLLRRRLAAGSYVLGLENAGPATTGTVTLRLSAEPARPPPSNDACALPADLVFTANETRTLVDASRATDDGAAACGGGGGPDVVYRLNVPAEATYTFTATPEPGSGAAPVLYLRKGQCDVTGVVQDCRAATAVGQAASFSVRLTPDTYYLWVDAASPETAGPVTVTVSR
ncbi:MAG: hypothetical protein INH37_10055, partial [Myxococcaceae bacterium]|nr:hypothetical protein [Myxococcaceae bacterium]